MKKIILTVILGVIVLSSTTVFAQTTGTGSASKSADTASGKINKIFEIKTNKGNKNLENIKTAINSEKESTFSDAIGGIVKIMTGLAVIMTFVGIVVAGGIFVFSEGEEGRVGKAKTIILYVIIGDLIIAASYAIIRGITLIKPL